MLDQEEVTPGDLSSDTPVEELQRKLGRLRAKAKEWNEEQGINVLFLALGFLHWYDEDGVEAEAPLLLLGVHLDRPSPRDPSVLNEDDDDISINPTLAVKLQDRFGIEIPDFEDEPASEYLDKVHKLIASKRGWDVNNKVYLANFAYSKLAMWTDLQLIRDEGTSHPIVRTLAGDPSAESPLSGAPMATPLDEMERQVAGGLDDILDIRDQYAVLPADYSQLIAIAAAKEGRNLVLHGPPGTGKSQTIANIISATIASGKTALFVSEQSAALDVVKRRLDESGLGVFCLDLHSDRANKSSVYQQLGESVNDPKLVNPLEFDYDSLTVLRAKLNRTVRVLHQCRAPLDVTVFEMQARLANIRHLPHAAFAVPNVGELTTKRAAVIRGISQRIAPHSREFREHHTSRWRVLRTADTSLDLANVIRRDMDTIGKAINRIVEDTASVTNRLGLEPPHNCAEVLVARDVAAHLSRAPGVPSKWIKPGAHGRLKSMARQEADQQHAHHTIRDGLLDHFRSPVPGWNYAKLIKELNLDASEKDAVERLLGSNYSRLLVEPGLPALDAIVRLDGAIRQLMKVVAALSQTLTIPIPYTLSSIQRQIETAETIVHLNPVPQTWLEPGGTERATSLMASAASLAAELHDMEADLFAVFDESILESVDQQMLVRYRTDHQARMRRIFSGTYKRDSKLLKSHSLSPARINFQREMRSVQEAMDVTRRRQEWVAKEPGFSSILGHRYIGRDTDWDTLSVDVRQVAYLLSNWEGTYTPAALLTDPDKKNECRTRLAAVEAGVESVRSLLRETPWLNEDQIDFPQFTSAVRSGEPTLSRLRKAVEEPIETVIKALDSLEMLTSLLEDGLRLREIEAEQEQKCDDLAADFGDRFAGLDTDWSNVNNALEWTAKLDDILKSKQPSDVLSGHCGAPKEPDEYVEMAACIESAKSEFDSDLDPLNERLDFGLGPWQEWSTADYSDILHWSSDLSYDADNASAWLIYRSAVRELDEAIGSSSVSEIRLATADADARDVPGIVERRISSAWLDDVYAHVPVLASFTSSEHDDIRAQFKQLDEKLPVGARNEVRRRVFERFPSGMTQSTKAGQLGTLRGELSKKRRQLPVRKLFEKIPYLLQTIKPCFLMSPLAVSQHLPISALASDTLAFDLVIFDEASQVFPEDAIPAILRGKKLLLAGDRKQLPPTSFFRSSLSDDDDDFDDDDDGPTNQLVGRESILDAAVGQIGSLFTEAHLNVHYRSRHEYLIQFSNHYFYDDRLLTFPAPGKKDNWLGVEDEFVSDGIFEGRRNRVEADKVVDLVFEHMRTRPLEETLGVVALSKSQADLIQQLIDDRRINERDVEERFAEGGAEPFFVKNLENV